ncbi:hypothetical protein FA13DRAFT_1819585, partial [Coprinellus micaceus]
MKRSRRRAPVLEIRSAISGWGGCLVGMNEGSGMCRIEGFPWPELKVGLPSISVGKANAG